MYLFTCRDVYLLSCMVLQRGRVQADVPGPRVGHQRGDLLPFWQRLCHGQRWRHLQAVRHQGRPGGIFSLNFFIGSFQIEWDMIVVTVFLSILNQMEVNLVQNLKENCPNDHIPFNMIGNGNIVFSVKMSSIHHAHENHHHQPWKPSFDLATFFYVCIINK